MTSPFDETLGDGFGFKGMVGLIRLEVILNGGTGLRLIVQVNAFRDCLLIGTHNNIHV